MARPLRIEYPGAFYHVITRGNAGCAIFKSIHDREKFFEYLEKVVDRFSIRVHIYCLMTNHFHLLVETPNANLSKVVQWVNVSYATYFNRKTGRKGHLFQ
ncbi:MAG: transposase, partial [Deltaproteobacteria bacterium]|nr:transposase [Deltaproteobacteria bacterium]